MVLSQQAQRRRGLGAQAIRFQPRRGCQVLVSSHVTVSGTCLFADCETDCPHAAFKHRNVTAQTPARESVEVRALVFTYPR